MQQKNKAPLNPQCTLHSRCQSEHKSPNMECINAHNCIIVNQISQYKLNKRHVFVPLCLFPSGCVHLSLWNTKTKHCIWTHVCYCMQIQKYALRKHCKCRCLRMQQTLCLVYRCVLTVITIVFVFVYLCFHSL